jgi:hypothetical protein
MASAPTGRFKENPGRLTSAGAFASEPEAKADDVLTRAFLSKRLPRHDKSAGPL